MAIPASWRGNPQTEPCGAFGIELSLSLTTTWSEIDVRSETFASRLDVLAALAVGGVSKAQLKASGIIRQIDIQNRDNADGVELSRCATAGGSSAPSPSDAYVVAMINGGAVSRIFATREEVQKVQIRTSTGTGAANAVLRFDVPVA